MTTIKDHFRRVIKEENQISTTMEEDILKTGCLLKAGKHKIKSWRKRWFAVCEDTITYYDSPRINHPSHLLGTIRMDQVRSVRASKEKKYSFDLETCGGRTYYLAAFSLEDREEWIQVIREYSTLRRIVNDDFSCPSTYSTSLSVESGGVGCKSPVRQADPMWWNGKDQTLTSFAT